MKINGRFFPHAEGVQRRESGSFLFLEYKGQLDWDFCRLRAFAVVLQELEDAENRRFSSSDRVMHWPAADVKSSSPGSW